MKISKSKDACEYNEGDSIESIDHLKLPKEIDITIITRRIEELNMLIIKDNDHADFELDKNDNMYKLKHRKEIKIGFYKNGIAIENFPFYEFNSIESQKILSDILDGYSPYILKSKYPKGVLMQVQNKLNVDFDINKNYYANTVNSNIQGLFDIKCSEKKKLSKDEFLNRLPNSILKDGKVYNIREDISNIISGGKEKPKLNDLIFGDEIKNNGNLIKKEIIDYSADRIEEINIYENEILKKDYFNDNKQQKNFKDYESFEKLNIEFEELLINQICKFKITIPILNGKNLIVNVSKKKFIKDIFNEMLDLIKKCIILPKYKLMQDWSKIIINEDNFTLLSTFPRKAFGFNDNLTLEQNKLFPTSVFIFEENKKI